MRPQRDSSWRLKRKRRAATADGFPGGSKRSQAPTVESVSHSSLQEPDFHCMPAVNLVVSEPCLSIGGSTSTSTDPTNSSIPNVVAPALFVGSCEVDNTTTPAADTIPIRSARYEEHGRALPSGSAKCFMTMNSDISVTYAIGSGFSVTSNWCALPWQFS